MARLVLYGLWVTPVLVTCSLHLSHWLALGLELFAQVSDLQLAMSLVVRGELRPHRFFSHQAAPFRQPIQTWGTSLVLFTTPNPLTIPLKSN